MFLHKVKIINAISIAAKTVSKTFRKSYTSSTIIDDIYANQDQDRTFSSVPTLEHNR